VRAGNWERVWRGICPMAYLPPPEDGEMMVWPLSSRGRDEKPLAALSHQTALRLFELGDFNAAKIHITVPPTFRRNSRHPKQLSCIGPNLCLPMSPTYPRIEMGTSIYHESPVNAGVFSQYISL
jgi:hypothetical protein